MDEIFLIDGTIEEMQQSQTKESFDLIKCSKTNATKSNFPKHEIIEQQPPDFKTDLGSTKSGWKKTAGTKITTKKN